MSAAYLKVKNEWSCIFAPSDAFAVGVKGREHTDRQDLGGWNWV